MLERAYLEAGDPRGGTGFGGDEAVGETLRNWDYTVAGEADGIDKNGVVLTRIAWTDLPEACYSIVSDTTLSPASLSGTQ